MKSEKRKKEKKKKTLPPPISISEPEPRVWRYRDLTHFREKEGKKY